MSEVSAWLLDLGKGLSAAVGELELTHVLPDAPEFFEIPRTPVYCRNAMLWRGEILPLMHLAARLLERPATPHTNFIAIAAYQKTPGAKPRYGALALRTAPVRIRVNDTLACDLPDSPSGWPDLSAACFRHAEKGPVPILDLSRVFAPPQTDIEELRGHQSSINQSAHDTQWRTKHEDPQTPNTEPPQRVPEPH